MNAWVLVVLLPVVGAVKSSPDVVVAHYDEDLSWMTDFATSELDRPNILVYSKGEAPTDLGFKATVLPLRNVGREAHTYLSHIVQNYEQLAPWTVFTQAGAPSFGYRGHKEGGGHLMAGDSFAQYLKPDPSGARFMNTAAIHLPSMNHVLRGSYCVNDKRIEEAVSSCPQEASLWSSWWQSNKALDSVRAKLEKKGQSPLDFYRKYVNPSHSSEELIVPFAQGARFAVSRERIQSRPKEVYEQLLEALSDEEDSVAGYVMEWLWGELFLGRQECALPTMDRVVTHPVAMKELAWRYLNGQNGHLAKSAPRFVASMPSLTRFLSGAASASGSFSVSAPAPTTPAPTTPASTTPASTTAAQEETTKESSPSLGSETTTAASSPTKKSETTASPAVTTKAVVGETKITGALTLQVDDVQAAMEDPVVKAGIQKGLCQQLQLKKCEYLTVTLSAGRRLAARQLAALVVSYVIVIPASDVEATQAAATVMQQAQAMPSQLQSMTAAIVAGIEAAAQEAGQAPPSFSMTVILASAPVLETVAPGSDLSTTTTARSTEGEESAAFRADSLLLVLAAVLALA